MNRTADRGNRGRRLAGQGMAVVLLLSAVGRIHAAEPAAEAVAAPAPDASARDRRLPPPIAADARPANVESLLEKMLPPRSDSPGDWYAAAPCLHQPGEPRLLAPCIPPAPCHPAFPPHPADLIGVAGAATCGPRYRGPCAPRLGSHDHDRLPRLHAVCDAAFDAFYR